MSRSASPRIFPLVTLVALLASSTVWAAENTIETVDAGNAAWISLSLDDALRPHIGYIVGQDIRYAVRDGASWTVETAFDDNAGLQGAVLKTDAAGQAHVVFADSPYAKYGVRSGGSWQFETLTQPDETIVPDISLAVDEQGTPVVTYWMLQCGEIDCDARLWQVDKASGAWAYNTIWSCLFFSGQTEVTTDGADNRHGIISCEVDDQVFYYGPQEFEMLPDVSSYDPIVLAADSQGQPHVVYSSFSSLRHRFKVGDTWTDESIVLSAPELGASFSLALDALGNPHVAYFDGVNDDLRYAHRENGVWSFRVIDGDGIDVGSRTSIAVGSDGVARIAYLDRTNSALRYAVVSNDATSVPDAGRGALVLTVAPNPSRDATTLAFALPRPGEITLSLYDTSGRRIRTLARGQLPAGAQSIGWDLRDQSGLRVAGGTYFARLRLGDGSSITERVTVVR